MSFDSDEVSDLIHILKERILSRDQPVLHSATFLTITQFGYAQSGFVPALAYFKTCSWLTTVINISQVPVFETCNVLQRLI